ncbi:DUF6660 family protein [Roseivirga pacifica]|uniref:DUF6660 family protein n=1 Tax=Roseivirga pacifica TaxID=1267423 RepID=UPI002094EE1C|nr:DUF6660 family protein [Roseivirga pacifica]MCO6358642.1 hypothetical protein [Roseivirga pacifica]MCO6365722.1 hypothetical protein [Roseivirga pacifica]MCO6371548.1 hypothetical protein [Roseivirga pacifica]MCO6376341.1 hypothetical protein [Roseivirga pacifica]MCO6378926.1 hypothetical protein [Roseivirga pacifica]
MRGTLAIVASFILLLSMAPCSDDIAVLAGAEVDTELAQTPVDDHQQNEDDECSPFCSCACCKVPIWQSLFVVDKALPEFPSKNGVIKSLLPKRLSIDVWHPPKA